MTLRDYQHEATLGMLYRASMDDLPSPPQRYALLEALSHLIERRGFETFVRAPLLEPSSTYFPDPWEPSERGVRALSLRLLAYAGLDEVDASVELYTEDREEEADGPHRGTAAWFAGIDDDVCRFGADTRQLRVGDSIVGTMCHEVAHAFRHRHELVGTRRQIEEEETDLTTIYLGFGILTTNNAYRFQKRGGLAGGVIKTSWSTSQVGYLSPQAMAFLLAAQAVARAMSSREVKRLVSHLETNQAAYFRASYKELSRDPDAVRITLGIPPHEAWPSERRLALPAPHGDAQVSPDDPRDEAPASERPLWNHTGNVFRVRRTPAVLWGVFGMLVAFVIAVAMVRGGHVVAGPWMALEALVVTACAFAIGRTRAFDICSEPRCEATLAAGAERCAKCGGVIRGR